MHLQLKPIFDVEGYFLTKFNVETGKEEGEGPSICNQENREMLVAIKVENNSILVASLEKRTEYHPELQLPFYWLNSMSGMVLRNFDKILDICFHMWKLQIVFILWFVFRRW